MRGGGGGGGFCYLILYYYLSETVRFIICHSRPKIAFRVGLVSRFTSDPRQQHLLAAKTILRYLKGTLGYGIIFSD